jgi:2-keto-4-pentenoate hydratase
MRLTFSGLCFIAAAPVMAACPDGEAIEAYLAARAAAEPAEPLVEADAPLEDALCAQERLVERLSQDLGPVVGYKAGLTSPAAQEAFGVSEPVLGTLLEGMLLEDGATVVAGEGVRPLFEADLIVEVGNAAINDATSPEEALPHIAGVRPFLETPDLAVAQEIKLTGPRLTATNVGAWHGIMGDLIELPEGRSGLMMLERFSARLTDVGGAELSSAPGAAVLGHPLNAVIWVADMLERQGRRLEPGDLVSVGSIGPLHPMKAGVDVTVTYEGLPGDPVLKASFR